MCNLYLLPIWEFWKDVWNWKKIFIRGVDARCTEHVLKWYTFFLVFFIRILTYENCNIFDIFTGAISISACLLMNFLYVILAYETSNIFDIFKRTNFNLSMSINKLIRLVSLFEIALLIIHLLRLIFISFIRV